MPYQQITDLAITGHNWLWNKGYNILSVCLQLLNTLSGSLLLVLPDHSTCPLVAPFFLFPTSSSASCEHFPGEHRCLLLPLYLRSGASGKQAPSPPPPITFNHPHVYSALRPPPPPFLHPPCPTLLPQIGLGIAYHRPASFLFRSITPPHDCFPTIFLLLDAFPPLTFPLSASKRLLEDAVPFALSEDARTKHPASAPLSSYTVPPLYITRGRKAGGYLQNVHNRW